MTAQDIALAVVGTLLGLTVLVGFFYTLAQQWDREQARKAAVAATTAATGAPSARRGFLDGAALVIVAVAVVAGALFVGADGRTIFQIVFGLVLAAAGVQTWRQQRSAKK